MGVLLFVMLAAGCKKQSAASDKPADKAAPAGGKLAAQLVGKWNDQDDGSLAYEFGSDGNCKALGEMECKFEVQSEDGQVLLLRYNAVDKWENVEVIFDGADKATWKNLEIAKSDPESAVTKLARAK